MRASLLGYGQQARPTKGFGYLAGGGLVLVGLAHLIGWLVVGGAWQGPVSLRKPTTFGLTTITLDFRPFLVGAAVITVTVTLALTALAFAVMQAPGEHDRSDPRRAADPAGGPGGGRLDDPARHRTGQRRVTIGLTTLGATGVMKVPHAVAMHAVQVLPALAWLLGFGAVGERRRLGLVGAATVGYAALVAVSLLQTAAGLAPLDVGVAAAVLSLLGVVLLGAAFAAALLALRTPAAAAT